MMPGPIYRPKGRAHEYAPLALNYYNGCDHGCSYCYTEDMWAGFPNCRPEDLRARVGFNFEKLERQLTEPITEEVLLCFAGDPYCQAEPRCLITRRVLQRFLEAKVPTAILTKGGKRCLHDLDLLLQFKDRGVPIRVGATLTFLQDNESKLWEPGAALPKERLDTLAALHNLGIKTWASCEPVIDPVQTLSLISYGRDFVDEWKVGKLNHRPDIERTIDWKAFGVEVVKLLQQTGRSFYIKEDLRRYLPNDLQAELAGGEIYG